MPEQPTTQVAQAAAPTPAKVAATTPSQGGAIGSTQPMALIPAQRRPAPQPPSVAPAQPAVTAPIQVAAKAPLQAAATTPARTIAESWNLLSQQRATAVAPQVPVPPLATAVAPLLFAQTQILAQSPVPPATVPATAPATPNVQVASGHQVFHDLFSTDGRGAVSRAVRELWGVRSAAAAELNPQAAPGGSKDATGTRTTNAPARDGARSSRPRS
jgi:hypothetical protein